MTNNYKFYMQRYVGGKWEAAVNIEEAFKGLKYFNCKGLASYGKIKNIYTETYAETDELRVQLPNKVVRENTDITFEIAFIGDTRRDIYHQFVDWLSGHRIKYWDTFRGREVEMLLLESPEPKDDEMRGDTPFIIAEFKFKNMHGQTKKHV